MYRIIQTSKYWMTLSIVSWIASIVLFFIWGLNLGIDFTGGTSMQLHFPAASSRPTVEEMKHAVDQMGLSNSLVQTSGEQDITLKLQYSTNDQRQQILDRFSDRGVTEVSYSSIGPTLGQELKKKAITALVLVMLAIIAYISYAFRAVSHGPVPSWMFGIAAIVALVHDVFIVVGIFVVLGHFLDVQIDTLFVTALLTILGFSVHDTIVVFDRIREGLKDRAHKSFSEIINESVNTTLTRSLNTSLTAIFVLLALYLFGGESIRTFVFALIIGIVAGTYSSIFIASPLLLFGQKILKK